jgi:nucleotide-binding universal stress UspA family protein
MYKHVLIATDGSELAGRAVATGLALAKALKAEVTGVTVTEPWAAVVAEGFPNREYQKGAAEQVVAFWRRSATPPRAAASTAQPYMSRSDIPRKESSIAPMRRDAI